MHEYPITQQIVKICESYAKENHGKKVTQVNLVVGEYSGFIGESIQMYFTEISKGTLCEGASISIERIKPKLKCETCGTFFERQRFSFDCPKCPGQGVPTEIGKEFYIKDIEIER